MRDPNLRERPAGTKSPSAAGESAILVGSPESVRLLANQIGMLPNGPTLAGCVLLDESNHQTVGPLPVLGFVRDAIGIARTMAAGGTTTALVSIPASRRSAEAGLVRGLKSGGLHVRIIPPLGEMLSGAASPFAAGGGTPAGELDYAALVGRTPFGIDRRAVTALIEGKRVLVTGAGGSIGREIVNIAATFRPGQLLLMERSENALFDVDRALGRRFPELARKALLHDVVDAEATLRLCVQFRPEVVFHAAAHKHVPLMEDHPALAVTNNFFGTKSIADAALAVGCERFVMISTDKAVHPKSVMGATKRLAEMYVQSLNRQAAQSGHRARFCMVRFGNVLGSACSVLPIWQEQLKEGGPLTVTDARMTRYFMTIQEAASLVIQAGAIAPGPGASAAPVFVLDMGEPVRILDLAQRFIRAHGFEPRILEPGTSPGPTPAGSPIIDISITGIRPGEKLFEQLAYAAEQLRPTPFPGINAWGGDLPEAFNPAAMVADLSQARQLQDKERVLALVRSHVPELSPAG